MIIDKGVDFSQEMDAALRTYGESMWLFREQPDAATARALNTYTGNHREYVLRRLTPRTHLIACISSSFQYLTPRIRITPCDLTDTPLSRPTTLHFICSPTRAAVITSQVAQVEGWSPLSIYEPIPVLYRYNNHHVWPSCRRSVALCRIDAFRRNCPRSAMSFHSYLC
jgi:hypothetical protein